MIRKFSHWLNFVADLTTDVSPEFLTPIIYPSAHFYCSTEVPRCSIFCIVFYFCQQRRPNELASRKRYVRTQNHSFDREFNGKFWGFYD